MRELLECYFCMGFWVSISVSLLVTKPSPSIEYVGDVVLGSFSGASFCFAFNSLLLYLEAHDRNHPES